MSGRNEHDVLEAAKRQPHGQEYTNRKKSGGVSYDPPQDYQEFEEQVLSILNERGQEIPDSTPMEPPLGYRSGPSLADFVQRTIRMQLSRIAEDQEFDTFEEAEDFDIPDDPIDPTTPYEEVFFGPKPEPEPARPSSVAPVEGGGAGEGTPSQTKAAPAPEPTPNEKT